MTFPVENLGIGREHSSFAKAKTFWTLKSSEAPRCTFSNDVLASDEKSVCVRFSLVSMAETQQQSRRKKPAPRLDPDFEFQNGTFFQIFWPLWTCLKEIVVDIDLNPKLWPINCRLVKKQEDWRFLRKYFSYLLFLREEFVFGPLMKFVKAAPVFW